MQDGEHADRQLRLERMMREYGTSLLRMCTLQLGDPSLAEDAVQDAFVKAYRQMSGFRGQSSERTWLMSIAINTCRDYLRSSWHRRVDGSLTPDNPKMFEGLYRALVFSDNGGMADPYLVLKDFGSYQQAQTRLGNDYLDQKAWTRKEIINVAKSGVFSSDRTIEEYNEKIWHLTPLKKK